MEVQKLKQRVLEANLALVKHNLVIFTWGNASEIDRVNDIVAIKPSGVAYEKMTADDIVVIDLNTNLPLPASLKNSSQVKTLRASSDLATHLELYRRFPDIGGIVHVHSRWATVFAQDMQPIPAYGTTHADYFHGEIPCTRQLTDVEINNDYELNTGRIIAECFSGLKLDPNAVPAVLAAGHAPFTWGKDSLEAAHNAAVLEEVAFMAHHMQSRLPLSQTLLDKHYFRKHGKNAYYGQSG